MPKKCFSVYPVKVSAKNKRNERQDEKKRWEEEKKNLKKIKGKERGLVLKKDLFIKTNCSRVYEISTKNGVLRIVLGIVLNLYNAIVIYVAMCVSITLCCFFLSLTLLFFFARLAPCSKFILIVYSFIT